MWRGELEVIIFLLLVIYVVNIDLDRGGFFPHFFLYIFRLLCDIELFVGDGQNGTMGTTSTDIDLTWQVMIPVQLQSSCD